MKLKRKSKRKLVNVPFESDIPGWQIVKMLTVCGELEHLTIQPNEKFWKRTLRLWRKNRFGQK